MSERISTSSDSPAINLQASLPTLPEIRKNFQRIVDLLEETLKEKFVSGSSPGEVAAGQYMAFINKKNMECVEKTASILMAVEITDTQIADIIDFYRDMIIEYHQRICDVEISLQITPYNLAECAEEWDKMPLFDSMVSAAGLWAARMIAVEAKLNNCTPEDIIYSHVDKDEFDAVAREIKAEGLLQTVARRIKLHINMQKAKSLTKPLAKILPFVRRRK